MAIRPMVMPPTRKVGRSTLGREQRLEGLAADVGPDVMDVTGRGDGLERRLDAQFTDWPVERVDEISLKDVLFDDLLPLQHDARRPIGCGQDEVLLDDREDVLDARVQLVVAHPRRLLTLMPRLGMAAGAAANRQTSR